MKIDQDQPDKKVHCMLKTWKPRPTVNITILQLLIFGAILIAIAVPMLISTSTIDEYKYKHYNDETQCQARLHQGTPCNITINIPQDIQEPVYLLYELEGFYQNYKLFFTSKSNTQLEGLEITQKTAKSDCSPVVLNSNLNTNVSWNGTLLDPNAVASPCGNIAKAFFNDTYALFYNNGTQVQINQNGLTWPRDKGKKYKQGPNSANTQWIDPQNEHFIVWMRTAGYPTFQKPWGIINSTLSAGNYTLQIINNYDIAQYGAHKNIILSNATALGGKNYFMAIAILIYGCLFLLGAVVFYLRKISTDNTFGSFPAAS